MIELKKAVKKFDSFTALDGADLKIEKGTAFGLLGSNGAGKSTILRLLAGIYRPDSGEVLICEDKLKNNSSYRTLPLIPQIEEMLLAEKERQKHFEELLQSGYDTQYNDYVCRDAFGRV